MSMVGDLIENVVRGALGEVLRKTTGSTGKRRRRRTSGKAGAVDAALRTVEKLLRPAAQKRQTSRRRTVRARSKAKRRSA